MSIWARDPDLHSLTKANGHFLDLRRSGTYLDPTLWAYVTLGSEVTCVLAIASALLFGTVETIGRRDFDDPEMTDFPSLESLSLMPNKVPIGGPRTPSIHGTGFSDAAGLTPHTPSTAKLFVEAPEDVNIPAADYSSVFERIKAMKKPMDAYDYGTTDTVTGA